MIFEFRKATELDIAAITELIDVSVRELTKDVYTPEQIELSIGTVFGVDNQLISDGTYFVAELDSRIVGCGGWSKRKTLFGASAYDSRDDSLLDPANDPAKVRAFFVHPSAARKGIGRRILELCESAAVAEGFGVAEMMATLVGVSLYFACGYIEVESVDVPMNDGVMLPCVRMRKELRVVSRTPALVLTTDR